MADAMRSEIEDPLAKWLLVTLCDYANDECMCWPSTFTLAKRTGMGRSTVAKKLNLLIEMGYVKRKANAFQSTTYCVYVGDRPVSDVDSNLLEPIINTKRKRKMGVPDDWKPSDELITKINQTHASVVIKHDIEANKFCDWHQSKGSTFVNIDAAYRNWCTKAVEFSASNSTRQTTRGSKPNQGDTQGNRFRNFIASIGDSQA